MEQKIKLNRVYSHKIPETQDYVHDFIFKKLKFKQCPKVNRELNIINLGDLRNQ